MENKVKINVEEKLTSLLDTISGPRDLKSLSWPN